MAGVRKRGETIRAYIVKNVTGHRHDITAITAKRFRITRQAVNHHIRRLVDQGDLIVSGTRSRPSYKLLAEYEKSYSFPLDGTTEEDIVWRTTILPHLVGLPDNVIGIWEYGVTEMVNNAIDHSSGTDLDVYIDRYKTHIDIWVIDDGVGIFKKIKAAMNLDDERQAVLELAKGKFTTDPESHSGEGIFFSSRMFDQFDILSGGVYYSHDYGDPTDWISNAIKARRGTMVGMRLHLKCARTVTSVFDEYASPEDYAFTKTIVPVYLAEYGDDTLVSRSQAKRLLTRIDRFSIVIFDFKHVAVVGQSFADEIFRVFSNRHPEIEITVLNANKKVKQMISRAMAPR